MNLLIASATGLYLCPEQEWTLCKRWVAKSWTLWIQFHPKCLFLGLDLCLWCKDLVPPPLLQKKKKRKSKLFWSLEVWMLKNSSLDFSRYSNFDIASLSRNSCSDIVSLLVIPKLLHIPLSNYQKNNLLFISQIENTHQVSGDMIWFKFGAVPAAT